MPKKAPKKSLSHPAASAAMMNRLLEIASQAKVLEDADHDDRMPLVWSVGKEYIGLSEQSANQYRTLVEDLGAVYSWNDRLSNNAIGDQLRSILTSAVKDGNEAATETFSQLVAAVESFSVESVVYVPVENLWLDLTLFHDGLTVGPVTFVPTTDALLEQLDYGIRDAGGKLRSDPPPVFAVFRTNAEPIRAQELAMTAARLAIALINFANAAVYWRDSLLGNAVAYIAGDHSSEVVHIVTLHGEGRHFTLQRPRNPIPIDLQGLLLEAFDEVGFWTLAHLMNQPKEQLKALQERILQAVYWFSIAQAQPELGSQLLNLVTCLEALIATPADEDRITKSLAEGIAIILYADLDDRIAVKQFVSAVYGKRSKISHGDHVEVMQVEVEQLRYLVIQLISKLLIWQEVVDDPIEFRGWLDRAKLASEPVPSPYEQAVPTLLNLRTRQHLTGEDLAAQMNSAWIDGQVIERWETGRSRPSIIELRRLGEALKVSPEDIALPKDERIIRVAGHLFHFSARRQTPGSWKAGPSSIDMQDAVAWPVRPIEPDDPEASMNPAIICYWEASGHSRSLALSALEHRIRTALEYATTPEMMPK